MSEESSQLPPPGWYEDPVGTGGERYWDGSAWTSEVRGGESTAVDLAPTAAGAIAASLSQLTEALERQSNEAVTSLKTARKRVRDEAGAYEKRVGAAQKVLTRVRQPEVLARLSGQNNKLVLTSTDVAVGSAVRNLTEQITAQVDTEGNLAVTSRSTLTRMGAGTLLAGPFGLVAGAAARKSSKLDVRGLYLVIDGGDWGHVEAINPDRGKEARIFAQKLVVAARGIEGTRARRAAEVRRAQAELSQAVEDHQVLDGAAHAFEEARACGVRDVNAAAGALKKTLAGADSSSREARRASKALAKSEIPGKLLAEVELPTQLAPVDHESLLETGRTPAEELLMQVERLPATTRYLSKKQFEALAGQLERGESSLIVASARRGRSSGALVVTNRRVISAIGEELESVDRSRISDVSVQNAFSGGKVLLGLDEGQATLELSGISPVQLINDIARVLKSPFDPAVRDDSERPSTAQAVSGASPTGAEPPDSPRGDAVELLRQLADLHEAGVLTPEEFAAKKQELLSRM